jgi:hypothetical protein
MREDRFIVFSKKVLKLCETLEKLDLAHGDDVKNMRALHRDLFSRLFMVRVGRVISSAETTRRHGR